MNWFIIIIIIHLVLCLLAPFISSLEDELDTAPLFPKKRWMYIRGSWAAARKEQMTWWRDEKDTTDWVLFLIFGSILSLAVLIPLIKHLFKKSKIVGFYSKFRQALPPPFNWLYWERSDTHINLYDEKYQLLDEYGTQSLLRSIPWAASDVMTALQLHLEKVLGIRLDEFLNNWVVDRVNVVENLPGKLRMFAVKLLGKMRINPNESDPINKPAPITGTISEFKEFIGKRLEYMNFPIDHHYWKVYYAFQELEDKIITETVQKVIDNDKNREKGA